MGEEDKEMLDNIDFLLNMDVVENEDHWDVLEAMEDEDKEMLSDDFDEKGES